MGKSYWTLAASTCRGFAQRSERLAIKMGRPSQEIALALPLPVLGTFWRVPERFWEPSRRFLNRVFTGFFCLLFLCCFSCFFLFLSSFFCFFISSFNSFFFSFFFLFVHISNYVWEFQKIFQFQIRTSKFVPHFKICSQHSKNVRALMFFFANSETFMFSKNLWEIQNLFVSIILFAFVKKLYVQKITQNLCFRHLKKLLNVCVFEKMFMFHILFGSLKNVRFSKFCC